MRKLAFLLAVFLLIPVMAEAGSTVTNRTPFNMGSKNGVLADVTLDSSYATGGESLTAGNLGLGRVEFASFQPTDGFTYYYDATNSKVKAFAYAPPIVYEEKHTAVAATGGVPASGQVFATKSNVTVTAGAYIKGYPWEIPNLVPLEVKSGTDLSDYTMKGFFIGR